MEFFAGRRCIWDGASTQNDVLSCLRISVQRGPDIASLPCVGFFPPGVLRMAVERGR
jgi:hypothetical protein